MEQISPRGVNPDTAKLDKAFEEAMTLPKGSAQDGVVTQIVDVYFKQHGHLDTLIAAAEKLDNAGSLKILRAKLIGEEGALPINFPDAAGKKEEPELDMDDFELVDTAEKIPTPEEVRHARDKALRQEILGIDGSDASWLDLFGEVPKTPKPQRPQPQDKG